MKYFLLLLLTFNTVAGFTQSVKKTMKRIPDSGQSISYTNTFGEDNDYSFNTPFYIDNGDGTITDTITGLMWQKVDGGEMTIDSAHHYVNQLSLAAYYDWRLPSITESFSLLNLQLMNPALNTTYFPNTNAEYWWCLDTAYNNINKIWVTNAGGGQGPHPKTETISAGGTKRFHTRAVRDINTPTTTPQRFIDNGDSTITDKLTGLIWQKFGTSDTMNWENALLRAESSNMAGFSDWRLPNIKEIESINNIKATAPSVYATFFPNLKSSNYWSSTTQFNHSTNAWYIDFKNYGLTTYMDKTTRGAYIICVRNPINSNTGLTQQAIENPIHVFYTNENRRLTIRSTQAIDNAVLTVFNAAGQEIYISTFNTPSTEATTELQLPQVQTGIYTYTIHFSNFITTDKFFITAY